MGTGVILSPVWAPGRVSSNPFWLFLSTASHAFTDLLNPGGRPSADVWNSLFLQLSPLGHTALPTLDAVVCPGSQLPLLNSGSVPGSIWAPLPEPQSWKSLKTEIQSNARLTWFISYLKNQCPSLPDAQWLENCGFISVLSDFWGLFQEGR